MDIEATMEVEANKERTDGWRKGNAQANGGGFNLDESDPRGCAA